MTATMLTEICHNVATEPLLQPLTGESFVHRSANTEPNARLDIRARGFWNTGQDAFFDVRVFHPNASSNSSMSISAAYRKHESSKNGSMHSVFVTLNMVFSHPLFSLRPVAWAVRQQPFIRGWQTPLLGRRTNPTQPSWDGSAADCPSPSCAPPSSVFEAAGHAVTTLLMIGTLPLPCERAVCLRI